MNNNNLSRFVAIFSHFVSVRRNAEIILLLTYIGTSKIKCLCDKITNFLFIRELKIYTSMKKDSNGFVQMVKSHQCLKMLSGRNFWVRSKTSVIFNTIVKGLLHLYWLRIFWAFSIMDLQLFFRRLYFLGTSILQDLVQLS